MTRPEDLAQFGSAFDQQLMAAIAAQEPHVGDRLLGELRAGNYEIEVSDTKIITVRIGGAVVLEAQMYKEPADVRLN